MSKPIQEMASHEIANMLEAEKLRAMLDQKVGEIIVAQKSNDQARVESLKDECSYLLKKIQMINPDIDINEKELDFKFMAKDLTEKLHGRKNKAD